MAQIGWTHLPRLAGALVLAAFAVQAAGPRICIVTDMEGVGGVNSWDEQVTPGQRRFEESRRLLTGEVNAAVAGAFDAGASRVVVWDGHDGSRTFSIDELDPRAELLLPYAELLVDLDFNKLPLNTDLDAAFQNSLRLAIRDNLPAALDGLLEVLRQDKRYQKGRARQAVLGILELLHPEDPITRQYRSELASILF